MEATQLRTVIGTVVLCVCVLAGCGSAEETRFQRLAYCQGPSAEHVDGAPIVVEFRQGATVVATGSVNLGMVFGAEVPIGGVQVYVDDVLVGAVNEGVDMERHYDPPSPGEVTYLVNGQGCPDRAST